jgi:pimeloyl-ACP methyl ester carboxylesterase
MRLNVEIKGQGLPILCLHGHPGNSSCLSVFTEALSPHFLTIAPDLRGYGKSHYRGDFQMRDHLEDLIFLLDTYEIDRALLLGWSLGGILALELALAAPERFCGLISIASAARPRSRHPKVTKRELFNTGMAALLNLVKPAWQWNINTFGKKSLFTYLFSQHTPQVYRYLATQGVPAYWQTSRSASRALTTALKMGYDRLEDLERINMPCLFLAGANDCHITANSSQETASRLVNVTWQCYPDTAHLFPWEIRDQVLADIDQWSIAHQFRPPLN